MARTKTKKAILQAQRSGSLSPAAKRRMNADYGAISQHVRVIPDKHQQLNKVKHKERIFHEDAPFILSAA